MGAITLGLGLLFLAIALLSLRRGRIFAGGRLTRSKLTGNAVRYIAIPQAIVGGLCALVGAADLAGYSAIGQYNDEMIIVLVATYLITNLGVGGLFQTKESIEKAKGEEEPERAELPEQG